LDDILRKFHGLDHLVIFSPMNPTLKMHDHQKNIRSSIYDQLPDGPSLTGTIRYGLEGCFREARKDRDLLSFAEREAISLPSSVQFSQHHLLINLAFRQHEYINIMLGGKASDAFL
jgi:hypothetical protein